MSMNVRSLERGGVGFECHVSSYNRKEERKGRDER